MCGHIYISQHYLVQHFLSYFENKFLRAHLHCVEIENIARIANAVQVNI